MTKIFNKIATSFKTLAVTALTTSALVIASPMSSSAATSTGTLGVNAVVNASCIVNNATLNFGSYDTSLVTDTTGTENIVVTCVTGTAYTVGLGNGSFFSNPNRRMKHSSLNTYLNYQLYKDAGMTQLWGNANPDWLLGTGTGSSQSYVVYGKINALQNVAAGTYSDNVTITLTF